jgi:uncharacterized protein
VLIIDTGVLLAAADDSDRNHARSVHLVDTTSATLITTALVIAEAGYLIDRQLGANAEARFYRSVVSGDLRIETLAIGDWERISELVELYADFPLGGTDASLVAIAERRGVTQIATLDHRHIHAVRPKHCEGFELLP